jgi:hypothetical protein
MEVKSELLEKDAGCEWKQQKCGFYACSTLYCMEQGQGRQDDVTTRNEEAAQIQER